MDVHRTEPGRRLARHIPLVANLSGPVHYAVACSAPAARQLRQNTRCPSSMLGPTRSDPVHTIIVMDSHLTLGGPITGSRECVANV
jgi:hypothetical protein